MMCAAFLKGDRDTVSKFASRLLGSPDIYGYEEREAEQSINFVTCHDGFTLMTLSHTTASTTRPTAKTTATAATTT